MSRWKLQGGQHYKVTHTNDRKYSLRLLFEVKLADPPVAFGAEMRCGIEVTLGDRLKSHEYNAPYKKDMCLKVKVGELVGDLVLSHRFKFKHGDREHDHYEFIDAAMVNKMCNEGLKHWPLDVDADGLAFVTHDVDTTRSKYTFENGLEDSICVLHQSRKKDVEETDWIRLTNFFIKSVLAVYEFKEGKSEPYFKVLCRHRLRLQNATGPGEGTIYLSAEAEYKRVTLMGHKYLDVEVIFRRGDFKKPSDLIELFQRHSVYLDTGCLTIDHLNALVLTLEMPTETKIINRFGRQPEGHFTQGNCCFKDGVMYAHDDLGERFVRKHFEDQLCPLTQDCYPKHIWLPYAHVRYFIALSVWHSMEDFFINNLIPARATLAMHIMGMHASKIWAGQTGVGHGMPIGYVYSEEPNTGKTEACMLGHAMLGWFRRSLWAGDVTKPALFEILDQSADLTATIDDLVDYGRSESKTLSQFGRAVYDRATRTVAGKVRKPHSSVILTSNGVINYSDKAFQSRLILIEFDALKQSEQGVEITKWHALRELYSSCAPDFEALQWQGKLDDEAIRDCCEFVQQSIGQKRDRTANLWGILLYYMLNINFLMQGDPASHAVIIEWLLHSVTRAQAALSHQTSLLDQFILEVHKLRADSGSGTVNPLGPMDRTIFWDKLRTSLNPTFGDTSSKYVTLRVDACIDVIKNVSGRTFQTSQVYNAIDKVDWTRRDKAALFYDTTTRPWPISKTEFDELTSQTSQVPLREEELSVQTLKGMRGVHFLQSKWDEIVHVTETESRIEKDYKSLKIVSAKEDAGEYNLFECVTTELGWFGFRACASTPFGAFCGANEKSEFLNFGRGFRVESPERAAQLQKLYSPVMMLKHFNYDPVDEDSVPPGYKLNVFYLDSQVQKPDVDDDDCDDYEQHSEADPPSSGSSSPPSSMPLEDITNKRDALGGSKNREKPQDGGPLTKKQRAAIIDEYMEKHGIPVDDSDDDDEEVRLMS